MKTLLRTLLAVATVSLSLSCGGTAEIGGDCDTSGATTDECVDGAICTAGSGDAKVCRKLCTDQADCADTEACNGVSGSNQKSCQPK